LLQSLQNVNDIQRHHINGGCFLESRVVAGVDPASPDPLTDENPELRSAAIMIKIFVIPETTTSAGEHGQPMFDPLRLLSLHWGSTNKTGVSENHC